MTRKTLHAPKGTDEANHDGVLYKVDNNGDVSVDVEAVGYLVKTGGFTLDDESDPDPDGSVRVTHSGGATSCSWGGKTYVLQESGSFLVPSVAALDLLAHGFLGVEGEADAPAKPSIPKLKIPNG